MWRLLVVLALCGASLVQGEQQWVSCNNIPLQNVPLPELQGLWLARKSFQKSARVTANASICFVNDISATSDRRLLMNYTYHYGPQNAPERVINKLIAFENIDGNQGMWSMETKGEQKLFVTEVLLVSSDPSNYLVMGVCSQQPKEQQDSNEERILSKIYIYARRQNDSLGEENLVRIIDEAIETLSLENYQKREYNHTNC